MKYLAVLLMLSPLVMIFIVNNKEWMRYWNRKSITFFTVVAFIVISALFFGLYYI